MSNNVPSITAGGVIFSGVAIPSLVIILLLHCDQFAGEDFREDGVLWRNDLARLPRSGKEDISYRSNDLLHNLGANAVFSMNLFRHRF